MRDLAKIHTSWLWLNSLARVGRVLGVSVAVFWLIVLAGCSPQGIMVMEEDKFTAPTILVKDQNIKVEKDSKNVKRYMPNKMPSFSVQILKKLTKLILH